MSLANIDSGSVAITSPQNSFNMSISMAKSNKNEINLKKYFESSNVNEFVIKKEPNEEEIEKAFKFYDWKKKILNLII